MMIVRTSSSRGPEQHLTSGGLLTPFWLALLVILVVEAVLKLFPAPMITTRNVEEGTGRGRATLNAEMPGNHVEFEVYVPLSGLIDPHNGDNGTDPAQTKTVECAGQYDLPVLGGVDIVAYWSLPDGAEPVQGVPTLMSVLGNYRFFFSSIENLWAFEADKLKYVPAWGGFCSYGVANEPVWTNTTLGPFGNPSLWKILDDDRLHIFRSPVPMHKFEDDIPGNIERGNDVWRNWFGEGAWWPLNTACFCAKNTCEDK